MSERHKKLLNEFSVSLPATLARVEPPPCLTGAFGISLETCETEYERHVAKWLRDDRLAPLWGEYKISEVGQGSSREQMNRLLSGGIFLAIRRQGEPEPLGFACAKEASPPRRHLGVGIFLEDRYRGFGYGCAAFAVFLRYLFHNFDAPKLAFDVFGWDLSGLRALARVEQFRLEGIRSGHFHLNDKLYDLYEMALSRDDFQTVSQSALWKRLLGDP